MLLEPAPFLFPPADSGPHHVICIAGSIGLFPEEWIPPLRCFSCPEGCCFPLPLDVAVSLPLPLVPRCDPEFCEFRSVELDPLVDPSLSLAEPGADELSDGFEGAQFSHCAPPAGDIPADKGYTPRPPELFVCEDDVAEGVGDGIRTAGMGTPIGDGPPFGVSADVGGLTGHLLLPSLRQAFFSAVAEIPSALAASPSGLFANLPSTFRVMSTGPCAVADPVFDDLRLGKIIEKSFPPSFGRLLALPDPPGCDAGCIPRLSYPMWCY